MRVCRCAAKQDNRPGRQNRVGENLVPDPAHAFHLSKIDHWSILLAYWKTRNTLSGLMLGLIRKNRLPARIRGWAGTATGRHIHVVHISHTHPPKELIQTQRIIFWEKKNLGRYLFRAVREDELCRRELHIVGEDLWSSLVFLFFAHVLEEGNPEKNAKRRRFVPFGI